MKSVSILGVNIHHMTLKELVKIVKESVINVSVYEKPFIVTPNVDFLIKCQEDHEFKYILNKATYAVADGMPLVWISRYYGNPLPEKVSGSSFFFKCLNELNKTPKEKKRIFLLGGSSKEILEKAIYYLSKDYINIEFSGYSPDFGFEKNVKMDNSIVEKINQSDCDLLFIGLGAPKQEKWLFTHRHVLNYKIAMCVGATIDFAARAKKMPPDFIKIAGMGWLWRMVQDPKRLVKRYIFEDIKYFYYVFLERHGFRNF